MKKNDLIIVVDSWGNVIEYTTITRVNEKTITVGYIKYDKETLKGKYNSIELFDKEKHGDGYKFDLILSYKREVEDMLESLESLVDKAKEYNHYIELNWADYEEDLSCLFDRLKEAYIDKEEKQ